MRIVIVDDEPLALERLAQGLNALAGVSVVGRARDGDEALAVITATSPDLVLMDIQMPGRTGVEVARGLSAPPQGPELVFVTAFTDFAAEAFQLEAVDYVLKPVRLDRLQEAVNRARRRLELRAASRRVEALESELRAAIVPPEPAAPLPTYETELWIPTRDGQVRLNVDQIRRIEAARDYALIHTRLKTYILRVTMGDLERRLDPAQLTRVHRSAFVRLDTVSRIERDGRSVIRLCTEDGAMIDVGASYAKRITAALGLEHGGRRAANG